MIKCAIFDLDDTLYDERDYCKSGFYAVARAVASLAPSLEPQSIADTLWQKFLSGHRENLFNTILDELHIACDDNLIAELVKTYRDHAPAITLPSDSRAALDSLKQKYKLALLTDGFLPAQKLKVKALQIENYFDSIIYTEELGRKYWKPSPAGFQKILDQLSLRGDECVYIADNAKKDFIAPNKLSFTTIQLKRPDRIHTAQPPDESAAPQHIITSLTELPELLEDIK